MSRRVKFSPANMAVWKDPKTGRIHWDRKHARQAVQLTSVTPSDYWDLRYKDLVCACLLDRGFNAGTVAPE